MITELNRPTAVEKENCLLNALAVYVINDIIGNFVSNRSCQVHRLIQVARHDAAHAQMKAMIVIVGRIVGSAMCHIFCSPAGSVQFRGLIPKSQVTPLSARQVNDGTPADARPYIPDST